MPHFDLVESVCLAGDRTKPNDDRAGANAGLAWVIDGATDLGPPGLVGRQGGAAWLAASASDAFAAAAAGLPLRAVVESVFLAVADGFERERRRDPLGRWELPSAAFLAVALVGDRIDLAWLADCACLLVRGGEVRRLGTQPDARETQAARAAVAAGLDLESPTRHVATVERLRLSRERTARRVLGIDPAHAADVFHADAEIREGDNIVLMSDGMAALIDDYAMPVREFAARLSGAGLTGLAAELRAIEAGDAGGARFPRFKRSDDATALWLRIA